MLRALLIGAFLSGACAPAAGGLPVMANPSAPTLRAIPVAHGVGVGERRTVRAVVEEGVERIATIPIADNATVVDVSVATLEQGQLVGVAPGETTLRIAHNGETLTVPVVVTAAAPVTLTLDPIAPCRMGERVPVRATARYQDGTTGDVTLDTHWSSPTSALLFVPNTPETRGAVVAISGKPGILRAQFGDLEASTEITPAFGEPSGIEVRLAWSYGSFRRFGAFAHWSDRQDLEVSAGCLWRVGTEAPFRGLEHATIGPWLPVADLSWDRTATCELSSARATGTLFAP